MKKVFWKCDQDCFFEDGVRDFTAGKEYEQLTRRQDGSVTDDRGYSHSIHGWESRFQRIEREVFTAHGFEWFKHVPGEPMPCEPCAQIHFLTERNETYKAANGAGGCCWGFASSIIGWRYADDERKEAVNLDDCQISADTISTDAIEYSYDPAVPNSIAGIALPSAPKEGDLLVILGDGDPRWCTFTVSDAAEFRNAQSFAGLDDLPGPTVYPGNVLAGGTFELKDGPEHIVSERAYRCGEPKRHTITIANPGGSEPIIHQLIRAVCAEAIIAAILDAEPVKCPDNMGVPKPVIDEWIRREDEHEAKQEAAKEALAKSEQEKADKLKRDGEALSRDFDNQHGHRMGWMG